MNCFPGWQFFFCWWQFVSWGSPFPSFDLTFVDQLGGTIYWRHVRHTILNQHIKGFNPNFIFHHYGSILKMVMRSTPKEKYRKIMTFKIRLWNLEKCSRLIKSCLHVWFISWVVIYGYNIVKITKKLILGYMHRLGCKIIYGGQKWAFWPSFDQK